MRELHGIVASAILCALVLSGCTSQSLPEDRLQEFSVISVQLPGFKPQQGDQLSWLTDVVIAGDLAEDTEEWAAKEITARVEKGLVNQGFTVVPAKTTQYVLFAALVAGISEELLDDQKELLELIRLYPMLGGQGSYERDMLVLGISTPEKVGDGRPLWKAAVEVFSAGELELPKATRLQRLDAAINRLLSTLPEMAYAN